MAKPTHPVLVAEHSTDLTTVKTAEHDVWAVTFQIMVKKGTNAEQIVADVVSGKAPSISPNAVRGSVMDITKVA